MKIVLNQERFENVVVDKKFGMDGGLLNPSVYFDVVRNRNSHRLEEVLMYVKEGYATTKGDEEIYRQLYAANISQKSIAFDRKTYYRKEAIDFILNFSGGVIENVGEWRNERRTNEFCI